MLCGGVAANRRLREMVSVMAEEHYAEFYQPPIKYCGDNGAMIAWMGQLMFHYGLLQKIEDTMVIQRYRTDQVNVPWMKTSTQFLKLPLELLNKGAEANIYKEEWLSHDVLRKERIQKNYRIKEIDYYLRKKRTKSEVKLLNDAKRCGVLTPLVYDIDKKGKSIVIENIDGIILKDVFDEAEVNEIKLFCEKIGDNIAKLHNCGIIHGDLTTSNMILLGDDIVFIDFGLGKISDLIEDKGVDLLVFKKALYGIHYNVARECFQSILKGYINANDYDKILAKLKNIEERGRYIMNNSF